ncbi:Eukaryotic elongation factor 2 kinase [Armadillidium vulgare]|nr:Eukaryotic elongation factor 2 kinase [Armadillidium vulgare]
MGLQERSVSESSDDIDIRPLELGDLKRRLEDSHINFEDILKKALATDIFRQLWALRGRKVLALIPSQNWSKLLGKMQFERYISRQFRDDEGRQSLYLEHFIEGNCEVQLKPGSDYGDGNLGTRGMALFFHSHICNSICKSLGLTQFDLAPSEVEACRKISSAQKLCKTIVRGTEEHVILPTAEEKENIQECIRLRSISSGYLSAEEKGLIDSIVGSSGDSMDSVYTHGPIIPKDSFDDLNPQLVVSENEDSGVDSSRRQRFVQRLRQDSVNDFGESTETKESNLKNGMWTLIS